MNISIIGGGITGLTTALALHKNGIKATVYEKADTLQEIGAGIWLQPNAIQILDWLGLKEDILQEGCMLNKMEISYPNLNPIKPIKEAVVADKHGNQTIAIHRGKLQSILYDKCLKTQDIELGASYVNHEYADGKTIIQFNNNTVQSDVLLGADGIHSHVRETLGFDSDFRESEQICTRAISEIELPLELQNEGKEVWGKKRRFGFSQIGPKKVYFFTVINKEICPTEINRKNLAELFKDFHPVIQQIISKSTTLHTTELKDLKRLKTWHKNNTCLLGDAAHATTPNMGQGAGQGIEDAYYISHSLKNSKTVAEAFQNFEKQRRNKVDYVVNNSWRFGKMAHSNTGQLIMKAIMKLTPEKVMSEQMNKLYTVNDL